MSNSSEKKINLGDGLVAAWAPVPPGSENAKVPTLMRVQNLVTITPDMLIDWSTADLSAMTSGMDIGMPNSLESRSKKLADAIAAYKGRKDDFLAPVQNISASISCVSTSNPNSIAPLSLAGQQPGKSESKASLAANQNDTIDFFATTCANAAYTPQFTKEDILKAIATMRSASMPVLNDRGKAEIEDAVERMYRTKNPDPDAFLGELKAVGYTDFSREDGKSKQYFVLKKYGCRIPLDGLTSLRGRKGNFGLLDDLYELLLSSGFCIADTVPHLAIVAGREYSLNFDKVVFATNKGEVNPVRPYATNYASFRGVLLSLAKWCCVGHERTIADVNFFLFSKSKSHVDTARKAEQANLSLLRQHNRELGCALEKQTDAFNALKLQLEDANKLLDSLRIFDKQKNTSGPLTGSKVKRKVTRLPAK